MHTGDVSYADNDGYLHITDRIKDVIKSGGEWISSLELEDIISRHEAVNEAAAIGVPDQKWGERPLVLVVIKPEFQDKINGGVIPKFGVPNQILIVDELAKTSVGKLNKKRLRKQYC